MGGRKKTPVASLFTDVIDPSSLSKVAKVQCKFCFKNLSKNGTRMVKHITSCSKCDEEIKRKYLTKAYVSETDCCEETSDDQEIMTLRSFMPSQSSSNESSISNQTQNNFLGLSVSGKETHINSSIIPNEEIASDSRTSDITQTKVQKSNRTSRSTSVSSTKSFSSKSKRKHSTSLTKRFSSQKNKIKPFSDNMNKSQINEIQLELAKAIFASGCPLNIVDNIYWKNVFKKLRPTFELPTLDMMSNSLMEKVYEETSTTLKELVASAPSVGLICDGWSNIRNEGIINFIITTPTPIIWSNISTGTETRTAEYTANVIKKILEEVGPMKVLGICTDNPACMEKAWELLYNDFPHIQTYGCLTQALHLIFSDISKVKSVKTLIQECSNTVKAINASQKLTALLKSHQTTQQTLQSIKFPVKVKWRSIIHCMESILLQKHALQTLAVDDEAKKILESSTTKLILSKIFWDKIEECLKLLKPVGEAILFVEGDDIHLSIVAKVFAQLQESFNVNLLTSPVLKKEEKIFKKIILKRREFFMKKIHITANLLDPRYRGCHLSDKENVDAMETIYQIAESFSMVDKNQVLGELANYVSKEKIFATNFIWDSAQQISPTSWWSGICYSTQLSQIAVPILNLPPTATVAERSFSRHSWIHLKKQNKLTAERAAKLAFISHNLALNQELHEISDGTFNATNAPEPGHIASIMSGDSNPFDIEGNDTDSMSMSDIEIENFMEIQLECGDIPDKEDE